MSSQWTPPPEFSGVKRFISGLLQATCVALCAVLLTNCSPEPTAPTSSASSPDSAAAALDAPPGQSDRPALPGQSGKPPNGADGLPVLPPHGVDIEKLFAPDIKDPIERIKRVENAVVELRHDFDSVLPAIQRLVGIENDMQSLIAQLDTIVPPNAQNGAGPVVGAVPLSPVTNVTPLPAAQMFPPQGAKTAPLGASLTPLKTVSVAPSAKAPVPDLPPQTEAKAPDSAANAPAAGQASSKPPAPQAPRQETPPDRHYADAAATAQPPPRQGAPPKSPTKKKPEAASTPASAGKGVSALALRVGDHGETVRIVTDVTAKATWHADLDNDENLLVVELPNVAWKGAASEKFPNPLVTSYTTQKMENGGTRIVIQLKAKTSIVSQTMLPPSGGSPSRIVFDLKK